jgi:hypothetical protein
MRLGTATDRVVQGDYSGDGRADMAVFRASTGEWFIQRSEDNSYYSIPFGMTGDIPAPADYDGDGKTDLAVFRGGTWYLQQSANGIAIFQFGQTNDVPVAEVNVSSP